jgi:hypothetical protein
MDSILLSINPKTSAPPSTDDAPDAPPPMEQFQAVMKRLSDGMSQSTSSGKTKAPRVNPPGVRSHKDIRNHKPDASKTAGFNTAHNGHQTAADSATGSIPASHPLISWVQIETPASPANKLSKDGSVAASSANASGKIIVSAKSSAMSQEHLPQPNFPGPAAPVNGKANSLLQAGSKINPTTAASAADGVEPASPLALAEIKLADLLVPVTAGKATAESDSNTSNKQTSPAVVLQRLSASSQAGAGLYSSVDVTASESETNAQIPGAAPFSGGMNEPDIPLLAETEVHPGQMGSIEPHVQAVATGAQTSPSALNGDNGAYDSHAAGGDAAAKTTNSNLDPASPEKNSTPDVGKNLPSAPAIISSHAPVAAEIAGSNVAAKNASADVTLDNHGDLAPSHLSVSSQNVNGTAVAQQVMPMNMAEKQNKFTGMSGQKLPGNSAPSAKPVTPALANRAILPTPSPSPGPLATAIDASATTSDATAKTTSTVMANGSPISSSPAQLVARTQDLMAMQVVYLNQSGADSLRVVIRPDANLQLSLQLQQHDGGIDVQVRMDQGDYTSLNQHWAALQQHFELRGIRVAPLTTEASFSGGGGEGFRQSSQSHGQFSEEEAHLATSGVLSPGYLATTTAASASASTPLSERWETWA